MQQRNHKLLAIVGPTAVGKTALSIELARALGGEIVSADSRQVYRAMNIGTAKASAAERALVPHHLIDIADPDDDFSLGVYVEAARAAIADITGRNRLPLLVGGTGQYVAAVLEGWQVPRVAPDRSLRARLEAEAEREGAQALHERLRSVDPQAADAIMASNVRRVIRALEVYELTGQPISAQQHKQAPPFDACTLWLTLPSEVLYARIDQRVEAMMAAGLLDEVHSLVELGYSWELPAMSSLGYREFQPYFAGQATLDEAVQRLKFNTHAFARRQAAWFRRLPNLTRLAADTPDLFHVALRWWETCLRSADQAQRAGDDTPHRLRQP